MFNYGNIYDANALREHEVNRLNNFIAGFYVPKNSELISDVIVEMHKMDPTKTSEVIKDTETKEQILTSEDSYIIDKMIISELDKIITKAINNYIKIYPLAQGREIVLHEKLKIRKYDPNVTFSSWKIDSVSDPDVLSSRHLSFMIFLNDDDNAYVKFVHQRVSIKSQKGLIVLYPSGWTFANMSTPSDKPLYVITGHVSVADKVKNKPKTDIEFTQFQFNDFEYNTEGQ